MRRIRRVLLVLCLCLCALLAQSRAFSQNSKIDVSVRLPANDVTEIQLSVDADCVVSLLDLGPVYEAASIDALCVLKRGPAPSPSIARAIFQVRGYSPAMKAPDREKPYPITDEDRKVLETLGPDNSSTRDDYPMKEQVTISSRMDDVESKNPEEQFYWNSDTTWFKSAEIRSLPMNATLCGSAAMVPLPSNRAFPNAASF